MMKKVLVLVIFSLFIWMSCKKIETDTTCVSHYETLMTTDSYTESDTSRVYAGIKTLNFTLKLTKLVVDKGICNTKVLCSNEWTISNLTNKKVIVFYREGGPAFSVEANTTNTVVIPLNFLSGITNPCMTLTDIKNSIKVVYN